MKSNENQTVIASTCISPYFLDAWGISADTALETEVISPKTLLKANRLDLACKLYYIDCLETGADMAFAKELYQAHIEAFSDGAFIEPGLKTKNTIQDYFRSFNQLISDMRECGFDSKKSIVPVGDNGVILDGSHRVAIAIYYNIPLTVVHIPGQTCQYNYLYFGEKGLREIYLDFMAYQFIRFSDRTYTVCLWPAAYNENKLTAVDQMIHSCADVAYQKAVFLNYHGIEQLMTAFYRNMDWTGSLDNGYNGVASKARACFKSKAPTTVYVIGGVDLDLVLELKQRIRDVYNIENASVHITDTKKEAVEAGEMLLFQNSIDFMNYADPYRDKAFIKDFTSKAETQQPCTGIDTTLALYGIGEHHTCDGVDVGTNLHHPKDYFYFWGVQLPSLDYVKAVKERSGDLSDRGDVRLIELFERQKHSIRADIAEHFWQTYRHISEQISHSLMGLREGARRSARVIYHRIKYRDQNAGKGEKDIKDLQTAFLSINTTTADYLVMRNWEGFYDDILMEGHNDIDLLCRDQDSRDIIVRLLDAKPLTDDGFHYRFRYKGSDVTLDTRILGDGYYDRRWQREMLEHKRLHPMGFYVMDPENYYFSLIYHAIYQKRGGLSEEYRQRLNQMSPEDRRLSQDDFAQRLYAYMRRKHYTCTVTEDKSVFRDFEVTSVQNTVRYPLGIRIRHFLKQVASKHLLQRLKIQVRKLIIRG